MKRLEAIGKVKVEAKAKGQRLGVRG